ncbi:MAG: hypothetical protein WCI72_05900 [archaeon]
MIEFAEFKKFFLFNLIGSLIIAALVAVVTVLVGDFNEITARVLFTLFMVVIHSLVCLAFIWDDEKQNTFDKLTFFINVLFGLIVISFFTSILGIWKIIPGEVVWHLYQTYFVICFASLHGDILSKALNKENYLDIIIYVNYIFMLIVVLMLQPIIYVDNATRVLGEMFFRILGAVAIIDGTLSILTIIFHRLYMNKHPKLESPLQQEPSTSEEQKAKKGLSVWVWILIIYLLIQIIFPPYFFQCKKFV